ncbi:MAG: signal peptidase I [Ruminococcus sp.]|nr:signal peptidase I [Ruminococcus sp.]
MKLKEKIASAIPEQKRSGIKKAFHVLRVIKNIVCWTLIVVLAFLVVTFLLNRVSGTTPTFFGYSIQRVSSGSMEPELKVGDVILSKIIDDVTDLDKGDIITFKGGEQFSNQLVTHRVFRAPYIENSTMLLQTKGDANDIADDPIRAEQVQSVMLRKMPFLTGLYAFFFSPWGLIIFIGLLILIFFDELLNVIRIATGNYSEEKEESIGEIMERIQREDEQKAREEKERQSRRMIDIMMTAPEDEKTETAENNDSQPEKTDDAE